MTCEVWLEQYIKKHQPVAPARAYKAGKEVGFTRQQIKKARRWHGHYIITQTSKCKTLWSWMI
jgi:hypothetical protein